MNFAWVVADDYQLDPALDIEKIKAVGPMWGSWRTWRSCQTDNVLCHDLGKARELLTRAFQSVCNFYLPRRLYQDLSRPLGCKYYDGEYLAEIDHIEEVIAAQLAATQNDIILLLGFDLALPTTITDRFVLHKTRNYHGLMYSTMVNNPQVQWVLVDSDGDIDKSYLKLSNLTRDKIGNVLSLIS